MSTKKERMYSLVSAWQAAEQSKKAYCEAHQINIHTFTYWHQKYKVATLEQKEKRSAPKFIPLAVKQEQSLPRQPLELCYPNGVRLRVDSGVSVSYLGSLIKIPI